MCRYSTDDRGIKKSANSKELFLHTEANAHLKEEIEENVKGIRLRSTELTRRITVQRKGWNESV